MTLDRGSSKHGPRLDEQLAQEAQTGLANGRAGSRADEWREPEPAGDDQPQVSWAPSGHQGVDTGDDRDPDYRDERARIASFLPRSIFPAGRDELVAAARENDAPADVIDILSRVDGSPQTAQELWEALDLSSGPRF